MLILPSTLPTVCRRQRIMYEVPAGLFFYSFIPAVSLPSSTDLLPLFVGRNSGRRSRTPLNPISKHRGTLISSLSPSPFTLRLREGRLGVRKSHRSHRWISTPHTSTYKRVVMEEVTIQLGKVTQSFRRGSKKQPSFTGCLSGP